MGVIRGEPGSSPGPGGPLPVLPRTGIEAGPRAAGGRGEARRRGAAPADAYCPAITPTRSRRKPGNTVLVEAPKREATTSESTLR